jgi:hypothetical protein
VRVFTPIVLLAVLWLTGCSTQQIEEFNRQLAEFNRTGVAPAPTGSVGMATQTATGNTKTELVVPTEKAVEQAMEEALPTIKKVLSLHQCVKEYPALRQLNFYGVPGVNMAAIGGGAVYPMAPMRYHDRNKCLTVRTIDQWAMPALNTLVFRAVYFSEDSGETRNIKYELRRVTDGSWKLQTYYFA